MLRYITFLPVCAALSFGPGDPSPPSGSVTLQEAEASGQLCHPSGCELGPVCCYARPRPEVTHEYNSRNWYVFLKEGKRFLSNYGWENKPPSGVISLNNPAYPEYLYIRAMVLGAVVFLPEQCTQHLLKEATEAQLQKAPRAARILSIGLGAGCLQRAFGALLRVGNMDVVDPDDELLEINKKFFYYDIMNATNHHFHKGLGEDFIHTTQQTYDAIFLDAFQDHHVPEAFYSGAFWRDVKKHLTPKTGFIAVNCLHRTDKDGQMQDAKVQNAIGRHFKEYIWIDHGGTRIFFAGPPHMTNLRSSADFRLDEKIGIDANNGYKHFEKKMKHSDANMSTVVTSPLLMR